MRCSYIETISHRSLCCGLYIQGVNYWTTWNKIDITFERFASGQLLSLLLKFSFFFLNLHYILKTLCVLCDSEHISISYKYKSLINHERKYSFSDQGRSNSKSMIGAQFVQHFHRMLKYIGYSLINSQNQTKYSY